MSDTSKAVDFNNAESIEQALAEENAKAEVSATTTKKAPKPRVIKVTFVADKNYKAGDEIKFDYEVPVSTGTRGIVAGIALEEMDEAQLKIEYRNANSVAYKQAKKNGVASETAQKRLDAVKAAMEAKGISTSTRSTSADVTPDLIAKLIAAGKLSVEDLNKALENAGTPTADVTAAE